MADSEDGMKSLLAVAMILVLTAAGISLYGLSSVLPFSRWPELLGDVGNNVQALIFLEIALPRIVVSLLAGAGLSLCGVLLQQILRNPLADASTLGLSSGAYLAIAACSLYAPSLLDHGQSVVSFCGAAVAACVVVLIGRSSDFSPMVIVLAGLSINLFCGSAGAALTVLNHEFLSSLFVWQSGSLVQNGWGTAQRLSLQFMALAGILLIANRPLTVIELGDQQARGLGVSIALVRAAGIALAVAFGALATSAVGVVGFVGLAAPNIARMLGARTFRARLTWAPLIGAAILWLTDQVLQHLIFLEGEVPVGAAAGVMGAPLMLYLVQRVRLGQLPSQPMNHTASDRRGNDRFLLPLLFLLLAATVTVSLFFNRADFGWHWFSREELTAILPWRANRIIAASAAGGLLAFAGCLLQRLTGNPMASPESLGVSAGAAMGVLVSSVAVPTFGGLGTTAAATLGAASTAAVILMLAMRTDLSPNRLLLTGVTLSTAFSGLAAAMLASGDPRSIMLISWMSGSTYPVTWNAACAAFACLIALAAVMPAIVRWLEILPLGEQTAMALGIDPVRSRFIILALVSLSTAMATILVGPLTFVGLVAPHIVRRFGPAAPTRQLFMSALLGSLLLAAADWLGRNLIYPWQLPAGLVSAMIGVPYFLVLTGKR